MNNNTENSKEGVLETAAEMARVHRVSRRTIGNWVRSRAIPCLRIGRVLRFDPAKVKAALERFEQQEVTR